MHGRCMHCCCCFREWSCFEDVFVLYADDDAIVVAVGAVAVAIPMVLLTAVVPVVSIASGYGGCFSRAGFRTYRTRPGIFVVLPRLDPHVVVSGWCAVFQRSSVSLRREGSRCCWRGGPASSSSLLICVILRVLGVCEVPNYTGGSCGFFHAACEPWATRASRCGSEPHETEMFSPQTCFVVDVDVYRSIIVLKFR